MNRYAVIVRINVCCLVDAENPQQATRCALCENSDNEADVIDCVKVG